MKKLLSIFLTISIALTTAPAKADSYGTKTIIANGSLIAGALLAAASYGIYKKYKEEEAKIKEIEAFASAAMETNSGPYARLNYDERTYKFLEHWARSNDNVLRFFGYRSAAFLAVCAVGCGAYIYGENYFRK